MIRLFPALCKAFIEIILTDVQVFLGATFSFDYRRARCARCGAIGKLAPHGDYTRNLVSLEGSRPVCCFIKPLRFFCASCKSSHALLPDVITPYSPYSLRFKLAALVCYYERGNTVAAVCEQLNIAVSTLYEWKKLMLVHKELMLGLLISGKTSALAFLNGLFKSSNLSDVLGGFFRRYAFSFMQHQSSSAARSRPP
jgi:hypothetical protein